MTYHVRVADGLHFVHVVALDLRVEHLVQTVQERDNLFEKHLRYTLL